MTREGNQMNDYYRHTALRARFKKLGVDAGKATVTFEIGGDELYTLPTLALLVGEKVRLDIESDQQVLLLDGGTGEVVDQEPEAEQMRIEEGEPQAEEGEPDDDGEQGAEGLPPAAAAYDELDEIFGSDAA